MNQVNLIGRLGADPEIRAMPSGDSVANLRLATSERWRDKQGEQQERTEWHRVTVFGKMADVIGEYLRKGDELAVINGTIRTREWEDKDGNKRYTTEVHATPSSRIEFLRKGGSDGQTRERAPSRDSGGQGELPMQGNGRPQMPQQQKPQPQQPVDDLDDDIPF